MYPRTEYEMTQDDLETILQACKPTPVMFLSGGTPMGPSQQENANRAWATLGKKMGFDSTTVRPIEDKGQRFFSAIPAETEIQQKERVEREKTEKRRAEIERLKKVIEDSQSLLNSLLLEEEKND